MRDQVTPWSRGRQRTIASPSFSIMQVNLQPVVSDSTRGSRGTTSNSVARSRGRSFVPRAPKHQPRRPAPTLPAGNDRVSCGQDGAVAAPGARGSGSTAANEGTVSLPSPIPENASLNTTPSEQQSGPGQKSGSSAPALITSMPPAAIAGRAGPNAARVLSLKPPGFSSRRSGGALTGSLRPGSSVSFAKPGSSLTAPASGGGDANGTSGSSSASGSSSQGKDGVSGGGAGGKRKSSSGKLKGKEKLKELTAENVSTMKIVEFCTSYKSRLPSKPREKGGVTKAKAAKDADANRFKRNNASSSADPGAGASGPRPKAMKVTLVGHKLVLRDEDLILDGPSPLDDNREEVDEDDSVTATSSSFTQREISKKWLPEETIKFYRGLQRYNTSFGMMAKMMFAGERSVKQLKKKYLREKKENPKCVNRALSVPINGDHPYFSKNPPPLPNFNKTAEAAVDKINKLKETPVVKCKPKGALAGSRKRKLPPTETSSAVGSDAEVADNGAAGGENVPNGSAGEEPEEGQGRVGRGDTVQPVANDDPPVRESPLPP